MVHKVVAKVVAAVLNRSAGASLRRRGQETWEIWKYGTVPRVPVRTLCAKPRTRACHDRQIIVTFWQMDHNNIHSIQSQIP